MYNEILFSEEQKFNQGFVKLILILVNSVTIGSILIVYYTMPPGEDDTILLLALVFAIIMTGLLSLFFMKMKLLTEIKKDGIYVQFFPIHRKFKFYDWASIYKLKIRQYSAIMEYGGYGMRMGFFRKGRAYNTSGDNGLQIETIKGTKILIGTQKPDELNEVLRRLGQLKE